PEATDHVAHVIEDVAVAPAVRLARGGMGHVPPERAKRAVGRERDEFAREGSVEAPPKNASPRAIERPCMVITVAINAGVPKGEAERGSNRTGVAPRAARRPARRDEVHAPIAPTTARVGDRARGRRSA